VVDAAAVVVPTAEIDLHDAGAAIVAGAVGASRETDREVVKATAVQKAGETDQEMEEQKVVGRRNLGSQTGIAQSASSTIMALGANA